MTTYITMKQHLVPGCHGTLPLKRRNKLPIPGYFSRLFDEKLVAFFLLFGTLISSEKGNSQSATPSSTKPTIVFVHGLWADGSCWSKVAAILIDKGYKIISVQNPTTSIEDDVAVTNQAIERAEGDVILVGHSWGGFVISEAGIHPKVKALVYVAAYVPEKGETVPTVSEKATGTKIRSYAQPVNGYITLTKEGIYDAFANDLPAKDRELVYAVQVPCSPKVFEAVAANTAWKLKPCWYIIPTEDNTIHPELEKFMAARAKAKTTIIKSSHVVMLSKPKEVTNVILEAVAGVKQ